MHPDQRTPDSHRYTAPDSEAGQSDSEAGQPNPDVDTSDHPEPDGKRVAEEGNAYTGRTMDDALKANPRLDEPGAGTADEDTVDED